MPFRLRLFGNAFDVCSLRWMRLSFVLIVLLLSNAVYAQLVPPTFQTPVLYASGGKYAQSVAVADVNRDGVLDLVVVNYCGVTSVTCPDGITSVVGVLLGNGNGTFRPAVTYGTGGQQASSVVIADVNGDSKPDLVVVNSCPANNSTVCPDHGTVGVLLGNGDGTFQAAVSYSLGSSTYQSYSVAVADLNGDGKLDVVATSECGGSQCPGAQNVGLVHVLLGNGDGTFQPTVDYNSGGGLALSVAIADVNRDGKPDLLVTNMCTSTGSTCPNATNGTVGVLLGNGDGTFRPAMTYDSGGLGPGSIHIADVNGDGNADVVVANYDAADLPGVDGSVGVLLGNGDGTFQAAVAYDSGGNEAVSVAFGDVNGDGRPDLLVGNGYLGDASSGGKLGVLLGNGDGTFQSVVVYGTGGFGVGSVVLADVNADGKLDVIVATSDSQSSGMASVLINGLDTRTTVLSSLSPSIFGQNVTFSATVTSQASATPTGTVTFFDGSNDLGSSALNASSVATLMTGTLSAGVHNITATYSGDSKFNASSSATTQYVNKATTKPVVTSSTNPALINQPVTFTVNVIGAYGGTPTGTVTFNKLNVGVIATETLSGASASFTTSFLAAGTYKIWATYKGDSNFLSSVGPSLSQKINKFPTSTAVTSSLNPSNFGQAVTFTATVTSAYGAPTGSVTFRRGTTALTTVPLSGSTASFTTSTLNAGTNYINAVYGGDTNFATSTSPNLGQVVKKLATTTRMSSSPNPSAVGQTVTFTATVSAAAGTPTGTVTFKMGLTVLGTATLSGGVATFSTSALPAGSNSITARYGGGTNWLASSSAVLVQAVH